MTSMSARALELCHCTRVCSSRGTLRRMLHELAPVLRGVAFCSTIERESGRLYRVGVAGLLGVARAATVSHERRVPVATRGAAGLTRSGRRHVEWGPRRISTRGSAAQREARTREARTREARTREARTREARTRMRAPLATTPEPEFCGFDGNRFTTYAFPSGDGVPVPARGYFPVLL
jgi:hypothetical protein